MPLPAVVLTIYFSVGIIFWFIFFWRHINGFADGWDCFSVVVPFWWMWIVIFIADKIEGKQNKKNTNT